MKVLHVIVLVATALGAACATGPPATPPPTPGSGATTRVPVGDPTRGYFINATSWSLRVWVDPEPVNDERPPTVLLQAGASVAWTLSQGEHRVVAHAHVVGQPSGPVVARFDRTIALDPKRPDGWYLRFREADFR